jgi:hypothetical protein
MKKRFAIPLAILLGLVFWVVVLGIIGSKTNPPQRRQQAEQPETANESVRPPEPETEPETQQAAAPEPEPPQPLTEEANALPAVSQVQAPATPLFDSVGKFREAFNRAALANNFNFQLPNIAMKDIEASNAFRYKFTEVLFVLGTVDEENHGVKEITMMSGIDGTLESSTNIFLCMAVMIASADPSLLPEQRGDILRELEVIGADRTSLMGLSTRTEKNGIGYFVNVSPQLGFVFGISRN